MQNMFPEGSIVRLWEKILGMYAYEVDLPDVAAETAFDVEEEEVEEVDCSKGVGLKTEAEAISDENGALS